MRSAPVPDTPESLLRHADFVRALAARLLRDDDVAADVAQEALLSALKSPPRRSGPVRPWLATLVRNAAKKRWRAAGRRRAHETAAAADGMRSGEHPPDELVLRGVVEAVLALPEPYRGTVLQRFYQDLPPREIARRAGVPVETVRTRLARSLDRLREALDREHGGSRRAWSLGLLHLSQGRPAPAAAAAPGILGGLLMNGKILATAVVAGLGILWIARPADEPRSPVAAAPAGDQAGRLAAGAALRSDPGAAERAPAGGSASGAGTADAAAAPAAAFPVRGTVRDGAGIPVAGVEVCVLADEDPFLGEAGDDAIAVDRWQGRRFTTDAEGRYAAVLPEPRQVRVGVVGRPEYRHDAEQSRWVEAPADGVDFTVAPRATAVLDVRAVDAATRRALSDFQIRVVGEAVGFATRGTRGDRIEMVLPVEDDAGIDVEVALIRPRPREELARHVHLDAGERVEVVLGVPSDGPTVGWVTDAGGRPLGDALVYFGTEIDGRGDEPFKPFDPRRLSGVRTGADGWFELPGGGDAVTAWHAEHGAATLPRAEAMRLVLPPRGAIRGAWRDAAGGPVAGAELVLDRTRTATTGADGSFAFSGVEPGVRGIALPDGGWVAVRVPAGGTAAVELGRRLERVRIQLLAAGLPYAAELEGLLVGRDDVASVVSVEASAGWIEVRGVLPGRYVLLGERGRIAHVAIAGAEAAADLGAAALTVHADPGTRIALVPEDADAFLAGLAARLPLRVPDAGRLELAPLPAGAYTVEAGGARATVVVDDADAELRLE